MQYSFTPFAKALPLSFTLTQTHLLQTSAVGEVEIPFTNITRVRIDRNRGVFKTFLDCRGIPTVSISNLSFEKNGALKDQSKEYTLFIRLLHYYLKDKSRAEFITSTSYTSAWKGIALIAAISLCFFLTIDYWGWRIDSFTMTLIGIGIFIPIIVVLWLGRYPKTYKPTDIPFEFLP